MVENSAPCRIYSYGSDQDIVFYSLRIITSASSFNYFPSSAQNDRKLLNGLLTLKLHLSGMLTLIKHFEFDTETLTKHHFYGLGQIYMKGILFPIKV